MPSPRFTQASLIRSICRESFFDYVKTFWPIVCPQIPVWNWHIPYLCNEVQLAAERVFVSKPKEYDIIVNLSPGMTKSLIFSVFLQSWAWTRMPAARNICGSHTETLVFDLSRKCRDVVGSELYQKCFPEVIVRGDQDAKSYWVNTAGGDRLGCTVGGKSPMGFHAHFLIVDDPIDPEKALSEAEIKNANTWMDNTLPSRKVDKDVALTILIMQRLSPDDPTYNMLEKKGAKIKHFCFPAEESDKINPPEVKKNYVDGLFDPVRLSKTTIEEQKLNGLIAYAAQYMQDPLPLGGGMFRREWFRDKVVAHTPNNLRKVRYWDKAATADGGAYTCGVLIGCDDKRRVYYILDEKRGQWSAEERNAIMRATAMQDGIEVEIGVEQEPGSGGKESAEITIKELAGYPVFIDLPAAKKEIRADPLSAQCQAGNVYLQQGQWNEPYLQEFCLFPSGKYKDRVDATAAGFNRLVLKFNTWIFSGSKPEESAFHKMPDDLDLLPKDNGALLDYNNQAYTDFRM
jgi:predicted phage terminase large subunit-like protein